jgi:hypothetical protein
VPQKCDGGKSKPVFYFIAEINSDNVEMSVIAVTDKKYRVRTNDEIKAIIDKV